MKLAHVNETIACKDIVADIIMYANQPASKQACMCLLSVTLSSVADADAYANRYKFVTIYRTLIHSSKCRHHHSPYHVNRNIIEAVPLNFHDKCIPYFGWRTIICENFINGCVSFLFISFLFVSVFFWFIFDFFFVFFHLNPLRVSSFLAHGYFMYTSIYKYI